MLLMFFFILHLHMLLWYELDETLEECNGPLLYQLKREFSTISQGDLSVSKYYTCNDPNF
ncbi:hypothetical protein Scep_001844 [Stephania cephalantha]|uniref:Uncharacterized protein n=1 Tax=Stephania cephalantha TaxID=152367 RepID=A0AAP0LA50_9MAGN